MWHALLSNLVGGVDADPETFTIVVLAISVVVTFVASILIGLLVGAITTCLVMNRWRLRQAAKISEVQKGKEVAKHSDTCLNEWEIQPNSAYGNKQWDVQTNSAYDKNQSSVQGNPANGWNVQANSAYGNKQSELQVISDNSNKEWDVQVNPAYSKNRRNI